MNKLQVFNSDTFGEIRTLEIDGKPYCVGLDVASALGYQNTRDAILRHCKGVVKRDVPTKSELRDSNVPYLPKSARQENTKPRK